MDLSQTVALTISGIIVLLIGWIVKKVIMEFEHLHERNDLQDGAISDIIGQNFNSRYLSSHNLAAPTIPKRPRDS